MITSRAVPRDALEALVGDVAADRVVDHVGAAAVGELDHALDEVAVAVVDRLVAPLAQRDLALLARRRRCAITRAPSALPICTAASADAARGRVHEQRLAGAQLARGRRGPAYEVG